MPRKFDAGDLARLGGPDGRKPPYPWARVGRKVKIAGVIPGSHGRHCEYLIAGRRGSGSYAVPSYALRRLDERLRAPGAGRRHVERVGHVRGLLRGMGRLGAVVGRLGN